MRKYGSRLLALLMVLCMVIGTMPIVFADGETSAVTLVESYPQNGMPAYNASGNSPISKITLRFSGAMSETALNASSYTITGGSGKEKITNVSQTTSFTATSGGQKTTKDLSGLYTYFLNVSGLEKNMKYTLSFKGLTDIDGKPLADGQDSITFYSIPMIYDSNWSYGHRSIESDNGGFINTQNYIVGNKMNVSLDETKDSLDSISGQDVSPISTAVKAVADDDASSNSWGVQIQPNNGSWAPIQLTEGKTYITSYRYKTDANDPEAYLVMWGANDGWCMSSKMKDWVTDGNPNAEKNKVAYLDKAEWTNHTAEYLCFNSGHLQFVQKKKNLEGKNIYIDDLKVYEKPSYGVDAENCSPANGSTAIPTDEIKIKYTGPMSDTALNAKNYTVSGKKSSGTAKAISVSSVEYLGGNVYKLKLSESTENMTRYTVTVNNVTDFVGTTVSGSLQFFSGENIITEQHYNNGDQSVASGWTTSTIGPFYVISNGNDNYGKSTVEIKDEYDEKTDSQAVKFKIEQDHKFTNISPDNSDLMHPYRIDICKEGWSSKTLTKGQTYTLSFRYKAEEPNVDDDIKIVHQLNLNTNYPTFKFDSTDWKEYKHTFTAASSAGLEILLNKNFIGKSLYFDDFKLSSPLDVKPLSASGTVGEVGSNSIVLTFNNEMNETTVVDKNNYNIEGSEIESIEKIDSKNFKINFKKLAANKDYSLTYNNLEDVYVQTLSGSYDFKVTPEAKLYFDAVKFYVNYGEAEQYEVLDGHIPYSDNVTAVVNNVINFSDTDRELRLVTAYYENGQLTDVETNKIDAQQNGNVMTLSTAAVEINDKTVDVPTRCVKAFLIDGQTLAPITTAASLEDYEVVRLTVAPNGENADYASPMAANAAITDSSASKRYVVDIAPGTYETYDEELSWYKDANKHGSAYGWTVKPYVTLRGTDSDRTKCKIVGKFPDNISLTQEGRNYITNFSTLNLFDSCVLENLTITAENMRYPIHDEGSNNNKNAIHIMNNCHIEHLGTKGATDAYINSLGLTEQEAMANGKYYDVWQWASPYGYGSGSGVVAIFNDSEFKSATRGWYVHSNAKFDNPQVNILNNCVMNATTSKNDVIIESLGSRTEDSVVLNNTTFNGCYISYNDGPWIYSDMNNQPADHAEYKVTITNSDPIGFNNAQRGKALAIYSNDTTSDSSVKVEGSAAKAIMGETTSRLGGGGAKGYTYGYYDISGIKVTLGANKKVNNTLAKRLGDCSASPKTMTLTFDGDENKQVTVTFDENYAAMETYGNSGSAEDSYIANTAIINKINDAISAYGYAAEYNVSNQEYYPSFPDKEIVITNNGDKYIPRFAAVCVRNGEYVRMTSSDDASTFVGITLERIVPGKTGRVLKAGYLSKSQMGMSSDFAVGSVITLDTEGNFVAANGDTNGLKLNCDKAKNWAKFATN